MVVGEKLLYRAVVFAGGGSRCFWQAGFYEALAPALAAPPRVVAAVSAGSSTASHVFAGRTEACLAYYHRAHAANPKNHYPENLFSDRPVFPGHLIYRGALETVLAGEGMVRLQNGPEIRVLMARPPRLAPGALGVVLGYACYALEKRLTNPVHPVWPGRLGFTPVVGRLDRCATPREVADLVLASSCLPPMLPSMNWQGAPVLDGGLLDNVPLCLIAPDELPALVLLTRCYDPAKLSGRAGVTYVQPSRPLAISKFENSNAELVRATYEQGLADGEMFLRDGRVPRRA